MPRGIHRQRIVHQSDVQKIPTGSSNTPLHGKKVEEQKAFFDSTTGKIVAVAGCILLAIFVGAVAGAYLTPSSPQQDSQESHRFEISSCRRGELKKFEPYTLHFVRNGFYTLKYRDFGVPCPVQSNRVDLEKCKNFAKLFLGEKSELYSSLSSEQLKGLQGYSKVYMNYLDALKTVECTLLSPIYPDLDIEEVIKTIHEDLTQGIVDNPGNYRTTPLLISRWEVSLSLDDDDKKDFIIEKLGSVRNYKIHLNAVRKFIESDSIETLSEEEKLLFNIIYHPFPPAAKVPILMKKFSAYLAEEFKKKKTKDEVFDFAATVHMKLVNIHPFEDGNGRMARILMNTALKKFGYHSVVFSDAKEYANKIQEDSRRPGAFAAYIAYLYDRIPQAM